MGGRTEAGGEPWGGGVKETDPREEWTTKNIRGEALPGHALGASSIVPGKASTARHKLQSHSSVTVTRLTASAWSRDGQDFSVPNSIVTPVAEAWEVWDQTQLTVLFGNESFRLFVCF